MSTSYSVLRTDDMNNQGNLNNSSNQPKIPTPLPYFKILVLGLILSANNSSIWMIFSFLPFMVHYYFPFLSTKELGYKAGILGSAFSSGSLLGNLMWGILSDRIGRRPVLMCGLVGTTISALCFGFSPSFWLAVFSRFMWGFLNGNIGVSRTYMGEILDDSNTAKGMALFGVIGGFGRTIGPIIGGFLALPADHYPIFKNTVFEIYPFSLPCIVVAFYCIVILIMSFFCLTETLPSKRSLKRKTSGSSVKSFSKSLVDKGIELSSSIKPRKKKSESNDQKLLSSSLLMHTNSETSYVRINSSDDATDDIDTLSSPCLGSLQVKNSVSNQNKSKFLLPPSSVDDLSLDWQFEENESVDISPNSTSSLNEGKLNIVVSADDYIYPSDVEYSPTEASMKAQSSLSVSSPNESVHSSCLNNSSDSSNKPLLKVSNGKSSRKVKKNVSFAGLVMVKVIGSDHLAFGNLKKIDPIEEPVYNSAINTSLPSTEVLKDIQDNINTNIDSGKRPQLPVLPKNVPRYNNGSKQNVNAANELSQFKDNLVQIVVDNSSTFKLPTSSKAKTALNSNSNTNRPVSILSSLMCLLKRKEILVSTLLYGFNAFLQIAATEIFPLWVVTSTEEGGFGYNSHVIGVVTMITGKFKHHRKDSFISILLT